MFINNGIVYGEDREGLIRIHSVRALNDMMMILTFSSGERRLFDATILNGTVFEPLKNPEIFQDVSVEYGVVTWMKGEIDCAPEYMYQHSYKYPEGPVLSNAEEAGPDEWDLEMLQEIASDPECHEFVSSKEAMKKLDL